MQGGQAARTGKIRIGDRLLAVNGVDVTKASHKDAVNALLEPPNEVTLTVLHEPLPKGWQVNLLDYCSFFITLSKHNFLFNRNTLFINNQMKNLELILKVAEEVVNQAIL